MSQVMGTLAEITGTHAAINRMPATPGEQRHSAASINLARRHLGWEPRVGLRDGLARQWAWLKENGVERFNELIASAAV